ncbi:PspC domain-containing protein [Candidatus Nanohalovita haloferacivicina]|uniref:PspC domain-containing protein n=1 Tax=Candidatus Nanohalovita haloferacivicina TaxID=2978046 RepID=UPI00325FDA30|nr:Phage shock protein C [Candidatus Nanohalobia archaeon BNXNv]
MAENRLYRSETDRILGGICGGIAEVYGFDPSVVRLITLLLIITGVSPLLYLVAWLIIPTESEVQDRNSVAVEEEDESPHEEPDDNSNSENDEE